ncbi:MAG: hypothetical protein CME33_14065 [Gimesia sp.]|uniref:DUF6933 domain-containing protein n=1 Tax=Gimesia sp. TaxID=2024833 RepID=UPI000C62059B|nr:hypothetical protein [Gimesia sp.]MAX37679.1 hypothetical protein [Gimesia sp.]|tara:strand:+ start:6977 stop:7294 length:318 start_codon:yes stop_codon:yes gene_type:complete
MIFRLSQKLNQKIKTGTLEALPLHQNPFADWSCHIFPANRRQYILLSNTKSLYSCVMPAKGVTNQKQFAENALDCIRDFLPTMPSNGLSGNLSFQKVKQFSFLKP